MPDNRSCCLFDPSLWLLLGIAASWVGVAQLARAAEKLNVSAQPTSIVHLMTWANATAWICLAAPHAIRRSQEAKSENHKIVHIFSTDVFQFRHAFQFVLIAFVTNYAYIGALHYIAASLNTAIFCTSPVFTLFFSSIWLSPSSEGYALSARSFCRSCCSCQGLAVYLSILGVYCIAEPWRGSSAHANFFSRMTGVALSLVAAVGTATYQVFFKATFGDRMRADEVGLFLAYMGTLIFVICGTLLAGAVWSGVYPLQLHLVPWGLVLSTSISSAVFNFLIKFGLSRDTPVAVSLATQIGIPMNLMVDVLVVQARIDAFQAFGAMMMLVAFSLQRGPPCVTDEKEDYKSISTGGPAEVLIKSSASTDIAVERASRETTAA